MKKSQFKIDSSQIYNYPLLKCVHRLQLHSPQHPLQAYNTRYYSTNKHVRNDVSHTAEATVRNSSYKQSKSRFNKEPERLAKHLRYNKVLFYRGSFPHIIFTITKTRTIVRYTEDFAIKRFIKSRFSCTELVRLPERIRRNQDLGTILAKEMGVK